MRSPCIFSTHATVCACQVVGSDLFQSRYSCSIDSALRTNWRTFVILLWVRDIMVRAFSVSARNPATRRLISLTTRDSSSCPIWFTIRCQCCLTLSNLHTWSLGEKRVRVRKRHTPPFNLRICYLRLCNILHSLRNCKHNTREYRENVPYALSQKEISCGQQLFWIVVYRAP